MKAVPVSSAATSNEESALERCRHVLLVDDHDRDRERLAGEFRRLGARVSTPVSARSLLPATDLFPDLIVADASPSTQADLLGRLRRIFPGVRLVILTGFPSCQAGFEAGKQGANAYLVKPSSAQEILLALAGKNAAFETPGLPSLERRRREYIEWVLALHEGNKTRAARVLGIPRYSLQRILVRFPPAR